MKTRITIGIDEVGRGSLAGPVVLAAVACQGPIRWTHPKLGRIRDSKKLTPARREIWFRYLTEHPRIAWRVTRVGQVVIDRINISQAANRGALRLVKNEALRRSSGQTKNDQSFFVWLDGGLKLPPEIPHRALIRGDEKMPIIAAASIIAKVWRDRYMIRLGRQFPLYKFEAHKGYGTRAHYAALRQNGRTPIHRQWFISGLGKI